MLDVLCVSDMCVDLVLSGNVRPRFRQVEQIIGDYSLDIGGSANIFASQFAKLGGASGIIGRTGADAFGSFVREKLSEIGVDTSRLEIDPTRKTGLGVALAEPDDRAILTYLGTINAIGPSELTGELQLSCRHWHVASYFLLSELRPCWKSWLTRLKQAGITISLDSNWDPDETWGGVRELLPVTDVFLPNKAEALAITGEADVFEAGRQLASLGPLVVIKLGAQGAVAFRKEDVWRIRPEECGPAPAQIADAIGAGDNFDAGFVRGWLLRWDVAACLNLATRCAVSSLACPGGIEGQLKELVR